MAFIAQQQDVGCSLLSHMAQANASFADLETAVSQCSTFTLKEQSW